VKHEIADIGAVIECSRQTEHWQKRKQQRTCLVVFSRACSGVDFLTVNTTVNTTVNKSRFGPTPPVVFKEAVRLLSKMGRPRISYDKTNRDQSVFVTIVMDARQKEFKWFGEGFDGFPKHLPEDCVEYFVYIIDSKLQDKEIRSQLRQIQTTASNLTKKLLKGYIWQRQSFSLDLIHENGNSMAAFSSQHRSLELSILDRRTELPPWSDRLWRLD
jgi:hypothetical protein